MPKAGQFGLNAGLHKFGDRGKSAETKDLRQFNSYDVYEPLYADALSVEEK
jgi:hypothetical protein